MADNQYAHALEWDRELVAATGADKVKGKANPCTSLNGNMFSFPDKAGTLCQRLPAQDRLAGR